MISTAAPGLQVIDGRTYVDGGPSTRGWHFHEDMLRCPQLWAYKHKLNLVFPMTTPLARGILFHVALSHYYMRLKVSQEGGDMHGVHTPVESLRICAHLEDEKLGRTRDDGQPERLGVKLADHIDVVQEAVVAYMARYASDNITVLAVEEELRAMVPPKVAAQAEALRDPECPVGIRVGDHPLGAEHGGYHCTCPGAYLYTQRPDMAASVDGWTYLWDHKTRGRKDYRQTRGYCMSGQFHGYGIFGAELWGSKFAGRMLNYATWGASTKEGRRAPEFERIVADRKPWAERSFPDTIRWSETLISMLEGTDPWKYPKTFIENGGCEHRYGPCVGQDLCSYGPAALATLGE